MPARDVMAHWQSRREGARLFIPFSISLIGVEESQGGRSWSQSSVALLPCDLGEEILAIAGSRIVCPYQYLPVLRAACEAKAQTSTLAWLEVSFDSWLCASQDLATNVDGVSSATRFLGGGGEKREGEGGPGMGVCRAREATAASLGRHGRRRTSAMPRATGHLERVDPAQSLGRHVPTSFHSEVSS